MYLERHIHGRLGFAPEKSALPLLGARVEAIFTPKPPDPDRSGLYVVSSNAGFQSSLLFWSEARQSGLGLANPELFPWTLANAPCGWLAREFHITGPNATYTGKDDALMWALDQADDDLASQQVETAWIVAVDFAQQPASRTEFSVVRLSLRAASLRMTRTAVAVPRAGRSLRASTALARAFVTLKTCPSVTVADDRSAWLIGR